MSDARGVSEDPYRTFLETKFRFSRNTGVAVGADRINPILKPHQRDLVLWAAHKGCAALFADFGLGKTFMQLEILRLLREASGGRYLQIAPLGVRQEFFRDAEMLGISLRFVRRDDEVGGREPVPDVYLTNYESVRDGRLDPNSFTGISLDEADVLRSYGSKTFQSFLTLFARVDYRFVATATPSPNRYKELIHYAGFLGVMDTGQALTRFFQRDSEEAGNLTLYPHMEQEFHLWLHSWAAFVQRPSDLGYSDEGYDLPPLEVIWHKVKAPTLLGSIEKDGQGQLIRDAAMGLADAAAVKRDSLPARITKMAEIVTAEPGAHWLLWHDLEAERHAVKAEIPDAAEVYGTLDLEERERRIVDFSDGRIQYLATKPVLSGAGCNFQRHCSRAVFLGVGFKFRDFIQAVHRIHRFQQTHPVTIHIIYDERETEVRAALETKWGQHDTLAARMQQITRENGLSTAGLEAEIGRTIGVVRREAAGKGWLATHNDCVAECRDMASNSVDLIHTSIPFGNHYEYSESYEDFGHNDDNVRFFAQMEFLTPELLRVLKPGRVAAIHVKDRVRFGNVTGYGMPSIEPFHADCIHHYSRLGFVFFGMITIVTDVVRENNQTYRLGYTEMCKDGTKMGVGCSEYVLLFRKLPSDLSRSYADEPVIKSKDEYSLARWQVDAHSFWRSSGDRLLTLDEFAGLSGGDLARLFPIRSAALVYDHEAHVAIGEEQADKLPRTFMGIAPGSWHPEVWHDVTRMRTLNAEQSAKGRVEHICPLQFDIVDRVIRRFTNKGDLVFDPFAGLMTVPMRALKLGRRGRGVELHADYFRDGVRYLRAAEAEVAVPTLFDLMREEVAAE